MGLIAATSVDASPVGTEPPKASAARGIPGARNVDHVGLTVPDLDQAGRFFVDVLGADDLFGFEEGPGTENPADLSATFDVDPRPTAS